jgi:hypothetical protein
VWVIDQSVEEPEVGSLYLGNVVFYYLYREYRRYTVTRETTLSDDVRARGTHTEECRDLVPARCSLEVHTTEGVTPVDVVLYGRILFEDNIPDVLREAMSRLR